MKNTDEVAARLGTVEQARFEVARGTDTEIVESAPEDVHFGTMGVGRGPPLVIFEYNKYHSGLPPWGEVLVFTLEGDEKATFGFPRFVESNVTAELKTVHMAALTVSFDSKIAL